MPDSIPNPSAGSITIAGLPIVLDWQCQLREFMANRIPTSRVLFSRHSIMPLGTNPMACDNSPDYCESPYPTLPELMLGELQWPSGASRFARALYCVDWGTLKLLAESAWGYSVPDDEPEDVPTDWGSSFYEVQLVIRGADKEFLADMFILRPYRVPGAGAACWLLPMVDARWKMAHKAFEGQETIPEDMVTLIEDIATAAGAVIAVDAPMIAGSPDKRIWQAEQPAVHLLDAACLSSGLRVVREPLGNMRALDQTSSEARRTAMLIDDWRLLSGGKRGPTELPSHVRVHVRKSGDERFDVIQAAVTGGLSPGGTTLAVWSSWLLTDANVSATNTFAADVASYVAAWKNSGGQYCFPGPIDYLPSGYDDFASIILEEHAPECYQFKTTVHELPGVFLPRAILLGGGDDECCDCSSHYLFTLAEYMAGTSALAEIRTMDDLTQVEASASVINTLGDFSHLVEDERGICVKVDGVYYIVHPEDTSGGSGYVGQGHVFTLTANLAGTVGATATATVLVSGESGVIATDPITVHNTGSKVSYTGAVGFAVKIGAQYWVAEVDQYPIQSLVTLDDDTHNISGAGTNQGEVADQQTISTSAWVAMTPYPFSFLPDPLPTIENPHNLLGLSGDKAIVTFNANSGDFELTEILPAFKRRLSFRLTAHMPTTTVASTTDFEILETREFTAGEVDVPTSISDPMHQIIGGRDGEEGVIEYSYRDDSWHVISFERKPVQLRINGLDYEISHDGGNTWTVWASGAVCP